MSGGPEYNQVELPFIDQLISLGWQYVSGSVDHPTVTGRPSFRDVLLEHDLRQALRRINLRNNEPWLDDGRIAQAIGALTRIAAPRLIEANQAATALLLEGLPVDGLPDWGGGRQQTIHYIDWDEPKNNTFTVISQFRVDCPRGQAVPYIVPDLVLFINGIPVVVVECKSPTAPEAIPAAVDQLRRYQNQRRADGQVQENEGNERLFFTNQILVVTCFDDARVGTICADLEHYIAWKDTAPIPLADVAKSLHTADPAKLSLQQKLIAGMLRPAHLLDIIRHFTLYQEVSGRTVKVVCRYQQFRAVHGAIDRLLHGKTRKQDGEHDQRGGIIWHTAREALPPAPPPRQFVDGAGFPYLGRSYRLLLVPDQDVPVKLTGGRFRMRRAAVERGEVGGRAEATETAEAHMIRWYSTHARPWLTARVERYAGRIRVMPGGLTVRDLGYRWGSCGKGGRLYFHWKTILLPPRLIEYVVVHELVHLREPHHDAMFWRRVERVIPDWAERREALREVGRTIW